MKSIKSLVITACNQCLYYIHHDMPRQRACWAPGGPDMIRDQSTMHPECPLPDARPDERPLSPYLSEIRPV